MEEEYTETFEDEGITLEKFKQLNERDLVTMGVGPKARKSLLERIAQMSTTAPTNAAVSVQGGAPVTTNAEIGTSLSLLAPLAPNARTHRTQDRRSSSSKYGAHTQRTANKEKEKR